MEVKVQAGIGLGSGLMFMVRGGANTGVEIRVGRGVEVVGKSQI